MTVLAGVTATQLAFLILRSQSNAVQTPASLAADLLSFIATGVLLVLSVLDHQRSLRPSSIISLYLSAYIVLGIARARTLWVMIPRGRVPAIMIATESLAVVALIVDSVKRSSKVEPAKQQYSPEQYSGFWHRAIFAWLAATFRSGYTRVISVDDLPHLDSKLGSDQLHHQLISVWDKYDRLDRRSLLRACFRSYLLSLLSAIIPRLCLTAFTFLQPFLLNSTVMLIGQTNPNRDYGKGLIGVWALVFMGIAISNSSYQYQSLRFVTRLRGGLTALAYQRSLQIREAEQGKVTAMAILGADIPQIVAGFQMIHEVWASLLDVAIATWLLERKLSLACLAPVVLVLIFIGITTKISAIAKTKQRRWIERIQERLKATSDVLGNIKAIKMLGLTPIISITIQNLRRTEIKASTSFRKVLLCIILLSNSPINLAPTVTFAVYVIISVYWKGSTLEVSQAFSSLALISLLTMPLLIFIQTLPRVTQALGCFDRIQEYCNYSTDALNSNDGTNTVGNHNSSRNLTCETIELSNQPLRPGQCVSLSNESFRRKADGPVVLKNLNVSIDSGNITALVGPVGGGKSTFLESLLGESIPQAPLLEKRLSTSVSYCSQEPWLENKTIRDSIIGENPYDDKWYGAVKAACDLESDITRQAQGDMTRIGSKGISLSGGQKQRIALARAVYARSSLIILDDVFSGMDARTVDIVSHRLLRYDGLLRRNNATVVLATTNRKVIALVDNVIALRDGEIIETGRPQDLLDRTGYVSSLELSIADDISVEEPAEKETPKPAFENSRESASSPDDQRRKHGQLSIYRYYFASAGHLFVFANLLFVGIGIALTGFSRPAVWLMWWSKDNEISPNRRVGMYMGVYAMLRVLSSLLSGTGTWFLLIRMVSNSADRLHFHLLEATLRAPFWFLTATDTGELMNRFSQDLELVDMSLPTNVAGYISSSFQCLVELIILFVFSRYLGIAVPVLGTVVYFLQSFYLQTSRQLRLLGIEAKAPLYSYFTDSVTGSVTIRAFGWHSSYQKRVYRLIDTFQRPEYLLSCVQMWLQFVLDTMVAALAVVLVAVIVTWRDKFNPGSVGVSLVMVIGFSAALMRAIKSWTQIESSIGAVARVKRFVDDTETEDKLDANEDMDLEWLQNGSLQIENLDASHSPTGEIVLKKVSMSVEPNQHIALCGRSGSGKTSLILSFLQMMRIRNGCIKIDNINIGSSSNFEHLRRAMNVVPQDPYFMPGTVRFNADPFGLASDDSIIGALARVGLAGVVREQGNLDKDMDTSAWSVGQKQLFCLARAMIKKGRILILDEAMSSVDHQTESIMQEIVDTEFKHTTVLAIMHRLNHVTKYDKVALLDHGELIEFDEPSKLIAADSQFAELWRSSSK